MGQKRPVQVFLMVTEDTLEENLLNTLSAKNELALAALDSNSKVDEVSLESGIEELKRRLEVLLGAQEDAPTDESQLKELSEKNERISESCGKLLSAAFDLCGDLMPQPTLNKTQLAYAEEMRRQLETCLAPHEDGSVTLTVKLPSSDTLNKLADSLAGFIPEST